MDSEAGEFDETKNKQLTLTGGETGPIFSSDDKYISFIGNRTGNSDIYIMPATGENDSIAAINITNTVEENEISTGFRIVNSK